MKGLVPLFLGLFGTFTFSWLGLTVIPNIQIGAQNPQMDEEQTDIYPAPQSGMAQRGRQVYTANGCMYCHSQQVRADYVSSDIDRKWGTRRSAPRDYLFDHPVLLGKERMGPDLANLGKRGPAQEEQPAAAPGANPPAAPQAVAANPSPSPSATANPEGMPPVYSEMWHHMHLYSPRSMSPDTRDSNMPAYKFLYVKHQIGGERSSDALPLKDEEAPPSGWEVIPSYDAKCLVAYLMSLDQSHPLKEVKGASAPQPASSPAAAPAGSPAAAAPPGGSRPPAPPKK